MENINALYQARLKFVMSPKLNLRLIATEKEALMGSIRSWEHYNANHDLFAQSRTITWPYSQKRPYKGDALRGERRMYFHLYFKAERASEVTKKQKDILKAMDVKMPASLC